VTCEVCGSPTPAAHFLCSRTCAAKWEARWLPAAELQRLELRRQINRLRETSLRNQREPAPTNGRKQRSA
jgi:hypothetical protein